MSLSPDEIAAVRAYSGDAYLEINATLRGEIDGLRRVRAQIAALDRAISVSSLPSDLIVYRGVSGDYAAALRVAGIRIGLVIREPAFVSTSTDVDIATLFSEMPPGGFIFRIRLPAGSKALDIALYSTYPGEREYLLARGAAFRVTGYVAADRVVEMELV